MHPLSQFILCVGGTTMIPGLEDRLKASQAISQSHMKQPFPFSKWCQKL